MRETKDIKPLENFNWDEIDNTKGEVYKQEEQERLEAIYDKSFNQIGDQQVAMGTVVSISDREVVVNIGFKSDGIIPSTEFRYNPELKIGDEVEVFIENQEDSNGQLILSHKKARILKSWDRVNEAYNSGEIIKGYVKSRTKGMVQTTSKNV